MATQFQVRGPVPKDGPLHPTSHGVLIASRDRGDGGVHQHALPEEEEEQVQEDRDDVSWKWKVILLMLGNQILVLQGYSQQVDILTPPLSLL